MRFITYSTAQCRHNSTMVSQITNISFVRELFQSESIKLRIT